MLVLKKVIKINKLFFFQINHANSLYLMVNLIKYYKLCYLFFYFFTNIYSLRIYLCVVQYYDADFKIIVNSFVYIVYAHDHAESDELIFEPRKGVKLPSESYKY